MGRGKDTLDRGHSLHNPPAYEKLSVTCSSQIFESYCLMGALDIVWILTDYLNCKYFP